MLGNKIQSPIPGISLETLTSEVRNEFGIPRQTRGLVVSESSGEAETFKKGVVIVEINGFQVNSIQDVQDQLKKGINRFYVWFRGKYSFLAYRIP